MLAKLGVRVESDELTVVVAPVHTLVMAVLIWAQQVLRGAVVAAVVVATVVVVTVAVVVVVVPQPEMQVGAAGQRVEPPVNQERLGPVPPRALQTLVRPVVSRESPV